MVPMLAWPAAAPLGFPVTAFPAGPDFNVFGLLSDIMILPDHSIYLPVMQR
jgi:hypothetical protein